MLNFSNSIDEKANLSDIIQKIFQPLDVCAKKGKSNSTSK